MTARQETSDLLRSLQRAGIDATWDDANTLRRAQLTLQRWSERECGDSNDYASFAIERDETTDVPYMVTYPHNEMKSRRYRIADRENGALRRVASVCERIGAYYFHQTDPRGCALYVSREPLTDNAYTRGIAC